MHVIFIISSIPTSHCTADCCFVLTLQIKTIPGCTFHLYCTYWIFNCSLQFLYRTHVAGTMVAIRNNGIGVVGVASNASIPLHIGKGLDDSEGGSTSGHCWQISRPINGILPPPGITTGLPHNAAAASSIVMDLALWWQRKHQAPSPPS